jgi:hypothetical protein
MLNSVDSIQSTPLIGVVSIATDSGLHADAGARSLMVS